MLVWFDPGRLGRFGVDREQADKRRDREGALWVMGKSYHDVIGSD